MKAGGAARGQQPCSGSNTSLLEDIPELNILILGQIGVGKSTFVNAILNYIKYDSLDDALRSQRVQCVIPTSFTWQRLVRGDYVPKVISVQPNAGDYTASPPQSQEEAKPGQSATRGIGQYTVPLGNTLVRLIDTPGIGDIRGVSRDNDIIAKITESLGSLEVLSGIVILLKLDEARLTGMLAYCLKELFTFFHRNAAKNIVFGFTHSRGISFQPGATYAKLQQMLERDPISGLHVGPDVTYCFDSEGFQCLAAHCAGVNIKEMGKVRDYRTSWKKSAAEALRMLMHFRPSITAPHRTVETLDLYWSRWAMWRLVRSSKEISKTTQSNVELQRDEERNLKEALLRCDELEKVRCLSEAIHKSEQQDVPSVVCSHPDCTVVRDGHEQYKSICHDDCFCADIPIGQRYCTSIVRCKAFIGQNGAFEKVSSGDTAIRRRIQMNEQGAEHIKKRIREQQRIVDQYRCEIKPFHVFANHLAGVIERDSIKPWNNSTLGYLDCLIDAERGKVETGASNKQLQKLLAERCEHKENTGALIKGNDNVVLEPQSLQNLMAELSSLELTRPFWDRVWDSSSDIKCASSSDTEERGLEPDSDISPNASGLKRCRQWQHGPTPDEYGHPDWYKSRWAH
ncbi:hypothetical protein M409DRAFT_24012 [Zasmidium cellare ATCC 36951]|uniref:DUF8206 domain-containing protein n=1 Tax=Zasmidium cellare ATCC 36951 TaxID=1080233 RepID=A0A6A6CET3_ZASCE|nr:uncharacterized protein M409DRAFT_24012 [Zasmidium cellare ATCC 36951]KAF2165724.1 hypothetical protein M409DRAFT_24012 [Zasmidium cellare ATCC 36951]